MGKEWELFYNGAEGRSGGKGVEGLRLVLRKVTVAKKIVLIFFNCIIFWRGE